MRLLLIRHGQTPANVLGQLDTARPGPGLTPLGERQAAMTPRALRERQIAAVFASTLLRTQLTAEPLATDRALDIRVQDGLQEIEAGSLEKRSDRVSVQRYLETVFAWGSGNLGARMPGGPDGSTFFDRFDAAVAAVAAEVDSRPPAVIPSVLPSVLPSGLPSGLPSRLPSGLPSGLPSASPSVPRSGRASGMAPGGAVDDSASPYTAAVFSHGAAIRVWTAARAHNVPPAFAGTHELDNTGVVELSGSPADGWSLVSWAGQPVGGPQLVDQQAEDPTGEPLELSLLLGHADRARGRPQVDAHVDRVLVDCR